MKRIIVSLIAVAGWLSAQSTLEQRIGQMLMVGFYGTQAPKHSSICQAIRRYDIGAVILFDYNPVDKSKPKNIVSKAQLKRLTQQLQACSPRHDLLIAVDQEGGKVQRLKSRYGFYGKFPSAKEAHRLSDASKRRTYTMMAKELKDAGINYDLAPVVDLAINPKNHVIYGLKRAFSDDPKAVARDAAIFIEAMHRYGIATALKHFPGHGSSLGDTHKGYVDVTQTWQRKELEPYRLLKNQADTVMVAHVFNARLDSRYPATLSKRTVTGVLRHKLDFDGVVITDDLQMGAITKKYTLAQTLRLAIEAGNDILLFGNQIDPKRIDTPARLVETIAAMARRGEISSRRIDASVARIRSLKRRLGLGGAL